MVRRGTRRRLDARPVRSAHRGSRAGTEMAARHGRWRPPAASPRSRATRALETRAIIAALHATSISRQLDRATDAPRVDDVVARIFYHPGGHSAPLRHETVAVL